MVAKLKQLTVRYEKLINQTGKPKGVFKALGPVFNKIKDYPLDLRNFKYNIRV